MARLFLEDKINNPPESFNYLEHVIFKDLAPLCDQIRSKSNKRIRQSAISMTSRKRILFP